MEWICRGYADAQDGTPYERAPEHGRDERFGGPAMPDEYLDNEWKAYMEGWSAGVKDKAFGIVRNAKKVAA